MSSTPVFLPGESPPGGRSLVGYSPWGHKESDMTEWLHFHHRRLECQSRKSKDTWGNRQMWPWSTEWSRAKANRVLPWESTGHNKHPLPIAQWMTLHIDVTRWSILKSDWLYSLELNLEKLYTVSKNKTRSWLWIRSWIPYCQTQTEIEESRESH